ncbi:MAG: hypothetical protein GY839_02170 [candidate division Zixibacteria bacterium]|nr:hypothetical protein [candidate division Zixibacteria bacterium]
MRKIVIFVTVALAMLVYPVAATVINVPDDYVMIQSALDSGTAGDTVLVQPGTYFENINFNGNDIVLGSMYLITEDTSFISATIIDGQVIEWASVITFSGGENNDAMVIGFTIANGFNSNGGGISCTNNSNPTISHNVITDNTGLGGGGGIYCHYSDPIITRNIIKSNWAPGAEVGFGGGIYCENANPTISFNLITGNSAGSGEFSGGYGGGIFCDISSPNIVNNTIVANSASSWAGGIFCATTSAPIIVNSIVRGNIAPYEPELEFDDSSTPTIIYCDITGIWYGDGNIDCDPMFCDSDSGNYYLSTISCCVDAGEEGVDIGAYGVGCDTELLYEYLPGDVNMFNGEWPPQVIGGDVTYLVNFFRAAPSSQPCFLDGFWCSADANGDCLVIGSDVTRLVNYLRGQALISFCRDYPSAWPTPDDLPDVMPSEWPNCNTETP